MVVTEQTTCDMDEVKHMALEKFKELVAYGSFKYKAAYMHDFANTYGFYASRIENGWYVDSFLVRGLSENCNCLLLSLCGENLPLDDMMKEVVQDTLDTIHRREKENEYNMKKVREAGRCKAMLKAISPTVYELEPNMYLTEQEHKSWWRFW